MFCFDHYVFRAFIKKYRSNKEKKKLEKKAKKTKLKTNF